MYELGGRENERVNHVEEMKSSVKEVQGSVLAEFSTL